MTSVPPIFRIEKATPADIPLVLDLIRELAEFEHLLHEARATEADLRETLFCDRPFAEVLIGWLGSEAVGFALFFHNYSTFLGKPGIYLEDLFVRLAHRGKGCGERLLRYLAQLAVQRGCGRLEWSVLDWNQQAIDFCNELGAQPLYDWTTFRVTGEALEKLGRKDGWRFTASAPRAATSLSHRSAAGQSRLCCIEESARLPRELRWWMASRPRLAPR